jgi:hypothetical protein
MSSQPPLPPYVPPGSPPPNLPSFLPPEPKRALGGDIAMKVLIGGAVLTGVGFGLCSAAAFGMNGQGKAGSTLVGLGAGGFFLGLLGIVVGAVWLLISAIAGK